MKCPVPQQTDVSVDKVCVEWLLVDAKRAPSTGLLLPRTRTKGSFLSTTSKFIGDRTGPTDHGYLKSTKLSAVEARQEEVSREYLQRTKEIGRKLGTPKAPRGP